MGGGRKPKSLVNVVVKSASTRSQLVTGATGAAVEAGGATSGATGVAGAGATSVAPLGCQTFHLERTKVAARQARAGMRVYGNIVGRNVEVRSNSLGSLGFAPMRAAAIITGTGRNRKWAGDVLSMDPDRLSIEVTLCPT